MRQLPLHVRLVHVATFASFEPGGAAAAVKALRHAAAGQEQQIALWGPSAVGKTHLLQAVCDAAVQSGRRTIYLPFGELWRDDPSLLEGVADIEVVCVDDVHRICGIEAWEHGLFHLINQLRARQRTLVLTLRDNPSRLQWRLPDLASRLVWGPIFRLDSPDDDTKVAILQRRATSLGFVLTASTGCFLLHHYERDLGSLLRLLDRLDRASLAMQRRVTVPFIKTVLESAQPGSPDDGAG